MIMKGKTILLLLAAAGTLSLAGCQKTGLSGTVSGDNTIRFAASAAPGTKTAYSGEVTDNIERIDWAKDDVIRIYSDKAVYRYDDAQHYSDYKVTSVSGSGATSTAEITPSTGNGLVWGDEPATYTFYGIYPATDCASGAAGTLTGTIPANQGTGDLAANMPKYGFLTAAQTATIAAADLDANKTVITKKNGGKEVTLAFEPAFTAIEVTLKSTQPNTVLTGAHLVSSSTALAGDFTVSYAASGSGFTKTFDCKSATGKSVSISGLTDATIGPDASYTFTLFALPQNLKDLELVFDIQGAQSRHLALKKNGSYIEFAACKKHRIYGLQMPDGTWTIYLQSEVAEWEENAKNPKYGEADDEGVILSAGALEFVSGYAGTPERTEATIDPDAAPLYAYYSVYSPTNGKWRITMKGEGASKFTLASETATTEGHKSVSGADAYVEGPVDQRVFFTVTPNGAASGDSVELYFTVVVGENEYSLHSEVTRSQSPLTVKMP